MLHELRTAHQCKPHYDNATLFSEYMPEMRKLHVNSPVMTTFGRNLQPSRAPAETQTGSLESGMSGHICVLSRTSR